MSDKSFHIPYCHSVKLTNKFICINLLYKRFVNKNSGATSLNLQPRKKNSLMINITFPDGAVRQYAEGHNCYGHCKINIRRIGKKVIAAGVNGQVWDASRPINEDATRKASIHGMMQKAKTHSGIHLLT